MLEILETSKSYSSPGNSRLDFGSLHSEVGSCFSFLPFNPVLNFVCKSKAEDVQRIMDNKSVLTAKAPIKLKVRPLIQLTKAVKIGTQVVHVDPGVLFMHLLVLVARAEKTRSICQL